MVKTYDNEDSLAYEVLKVLRQAKVECFSPNKQVQCIIGPMDKFQQYEYTIETCPIRLIFGCNLCKRLSDSSFSE